MTKKDYFKFSCLLAGMIAGWFIDGYWGGLMSGLFSSFLIGATIGKFLYKKSAEQLEATMKKRYRNE